MKIVKFVMLSCESEAYTALLYILNQSKFISNLKLILKIYNRVLKTWGLNKSLSQSEKVLIKEKYLLLPKQSVEWSIWLRQMWQMYRSSFFYSANIQQAIKQSS